MKNSHQVVTKIAVPDIIKKSEDLDPTTFKFLIKNLALRLAIEGTLVSIFEICTFPHVKKIYFLPNNDPHRKLIDLSLHSDLSLPIHNNYDHLTKDSLMATHPTSRPKMMEVFDNYAKYSVKYSVDPHAAYFAVKHHHLISVIFEDSFYSLTSQQKKDLIVRMNNSLKKSRNCYRLVRSADRIAMETEIRKTLNNQPFYLIDKNNHQNIISGFMPYGWGANRESVLINQAIIAGLDQQPPESTIPDTPNKNKLKI